MSGNLRRVSLIAVAFAAAVVASGCTDSAGQDVPFGIGVTGFDRNKWDVPTGGWCTMPDGKLNTPMCFETLGAVLQIRSREEAGLRQLEAPEDQRWMYDY